MIKSFINGFCGVFNAPVILEHTGTYVAITIILIVFILWALFGFLFIIGIWELTKILFKKIRRSKND